jgi:branched-subunit amino acid ABC-type transport system permease component
LAQALLNGLIAGLLIALPAIALSLSYGVLNFANFAIGAMVTLGAYLAYAFNADLGLPLAVAAPIAAAGLAVVAIATQRLVYDRIRDGDHITLLVASMGVAFVIENSVRFVYGADVRTLDVPVARPVIWHGLRLNREQLVIAATVLATLVVVSVVLRSTRFGRSMRAVSDNPALAEARGIDRARTVAGTWALAGALAALAGVLIALDSTVEPLIGTNYLVSIFAAAIVGGIGNPFGAMAGGLLIGMVEELSTLAVPTTYRQGVSFLVLALVLFTRPHGLFGVARIAR